MGVRHPAGPLALPHVTENHPSHPTPPLDIAMATEGARPGQSATDHLLLRHLANSLVLTPVMNSLDQRSPNCNVHTTPDTPIRCDRAAQRAQTMPRVPVHTRMRQPSTMHDRARHRAPSTLTPSHCPLAGHGAPATPQSNRTRTEPSPVPIAPESHRCRSPYT
jgi:hypothetical protein